MEYVLPEQQAVFVKELDAHVLKCVKDANGNHVSKIVDFYSVVLTLLSGYSKASRKSVSRAAGLRAIVQG